MMKYSMILSIVAIVLCGSFADSKGNTIKYIAKYSTNKDPSVVECVFDEKTRQFISRRGGAVIEVVQYKSRDEFIAEHRGGGRSYGISIQSREPDYNEDRTMKFDVQGRLVREEGNDLTIEWTEWDNKKRNIKGKLSFTGWIHSLDLSITYDDTLRTGTMKITVPESIRKEMGKMTETTVVMFDEYYNELSRKNTRFNGEKDEETKIILEYKEIE
ncbi:MAG TPA: hypothetical protein PKK43_11695 [Spirochaetota bacterium]|nr:hypothetical protein [Spirochaetota bacterium]